MASINPEEQEAADPWDRVPWRVSDVALAAGAVIAGVVVIILLAALTFDSASEQTENLLTPWIIAVAEGMMLAAVWAFAVRRHGVSWAAVGLRRSRARHGFPLAVAAFGGSILFTAAYAAVVSLLELDLLVPEPIHEGFIGSGVSRILNGLMIVVWAPFAEEVFFRGFLLAALVPVLGAARAIIVSAVIFAVVHIAIGSMIPIFVTGVLLGWLYLRTKSLWPPITAHALQNLFAFALA